MTEIGVYGLIYTKASISAQAMKIWRSSFMKCLSMEYQKKTLQCQSKLDINITYGLQQGSFFAS